MEENLEKLVESIADKEGLEEDEVMKKIESKEEEYSGLISKEGAAHIVAKEAGIEMMGDEKKSLDIGNIVSGMNSVTVTGKIQRIFDVREFESDNGEGKVVNLILADETGSVRMSLWNEEVERLIEEGKVEEGDVIKIENGYVREDNRNNPELRLGRSGKVKKSDENIDVKTSQPSSGGKDEGRVKIRELTPGVRGEIRGTILRIFANKPFFRTCPECDKRVEEECEEHGKFKVNMALSGVVDDGTGSIRSVFFDGEAEELVGVETDKAWELTDEGESPEKFQEKCDESLGDELILKGRGQMNDFFGRPEFIVNDVDSADPKDEAKKILEEL